VATLKGLGNESDPVPRHFRVGLQVVACLRDSAYFEFQTPKVEVTASCVEGLPYRPGRRDIIGALSEIVTKNLMLPQHAFVKMYYFAIESLAIIR